MSATPLFESPHIERLPTPIYREVFGMMTEIAANGEANSADETAKAIEETIAFFGRLWTAEYLSGIASHPALFDPDLNAEVLERLGHGKPMLTGAWLELSRKIRARFVITETPTVVEGLTAYEPGTGSDHENALNRLLAFRNVFAHGSFLASVGEIRAHRHLLHDVLAAVPGLVSQPVLSRDPESGVWFAADGQWRAAEPPDVYAKPGEPVITGSREQSVNLYPLLAVRQAPLPSLEPPGGSATRTGLSEHPALGVWLGRYEWERQGHIEYTPTAAPQVLDAKLVDWLSSALVTDGLVLVDTSPGTRADDILAALASDDPRVLGLSMFASMSRVRVVPGAVSQSGLSVARAVLRLVERALDEKERWRALSRRTNALLPDGPRAKALADLKASGRRALLALGKAIARRIRCRTPHIGRSARA